MKTNTKKVFITQAELDAIKAKAWDTQQAIDAAERRATDAEAKLAALDAERVSEAARPRRAANAFGRPLTEAEPPRNVFGRAPLPDGTFGREQMPGFDGLGRPVSESKPTNWRDRLSARATGRKEK